MILLRCRLYLVNNNSHVHQHFKEVWHLDFASSFSSFHAQFQLVFRVETCPFFTYSRTFLIECFLNLTLNSSPSVINLWKHQNMNFLLVRWSLCKACVFVLEIKFYLNLCDNFCFACPQLINSSLKIILGIQTNRS